MRTASHVTEVYENIRRLARIFTISDFKDFNISCKISRFHVRFRDFKKDFQPSVRNFKLVANPSSMLVYGLFYNSMRCTRIRGALCTDSVYQALFSGLHWDKASNRVCSFKKELLVSYHCNTQYITFIECTY